MVEVVSMGCADGSPDDNFRRRGSAFRLDDVHWLTSGHAVAGADTIELLVDGPDGASRTDVSVSRVDPLNDLALLVTGEGPLRPKSRGVSTRFRTDPVAPEDNVTIQTPAAKELSGEVGRVMNASIEAIDGSGPVRRPTIELLADIESGDSGSPVMDDAGLVAGVVYGASQSGDKKAYAVTANVIEALVRGRSGVDGAGSCPSRRASTVPE